MISGHQQKRKSKKDELKKKIKRQNNSKYTKKLLQACKTWGDPCITPNELELCIQNKPDI